MAEESRREFWERTQGASSPVIDDHRVDAPIGKGQYLNRVEDTTEVIIRYGVHVIDPGPNAERVADLIQGTAWRTDGSDPRTEYSISYPEKEKETVLVNAAKAITLGAKLKVTKYVRVEHSFPGLNKGCKVVDASEARTTFTVKVNSWGSNRTRVQELLIGKGGSGNLKLSLPLELTYGGWEKDAMMELAQQLVDLGVDVEIKKQTGITVPLN